MVNPPPTPDTTLTDALMYSEVMQTLRHYGSLRFQMLAVFLTAFGALAAAYSLGVKPLLEAGSGWVATAGLMLSVMFGLLEAALSNNLRLLWDAAAGLAKTRYPAAFVHRDSRYVPLARWALLLWYGACIVFWVGCLLRH